MTTNAPWNRPNETWRLGSYELPPERRAAKIDRRVLERLEALGDRRTNRRSLRSLFRL